MATEQRRQFGPESLEEALDLARQCARLKEEWTELDNTWEEALRLRHLLYLAAKPDFVPPARFQQAMETCVECLLAGSGGSGAGNASLLSPERLLQLLDSPDALPLLQYLSWLEEALKEITSGDGPSGSSFRTVLVPQRAKGALKSWPAERSLLQQSACALWEALLLQGPKHLRHAKEWQEALQERQAIQRHQTEECQRVARELHETAGFFVAQVEEHSGAEWPELARVTQESLWRVQQVAGDLLQNQKECWSQAMEDYEAFASRVSSCRASLQEVRRQVRRHEQAFSQAAQRFTEVANQLVAWTSVLVPKLRVLEAKRAELREALELRKRLPLLEREHMHAEDELDTAQTELRKQKRRQASSQRRGEAATAGYILEHQCELRVAHAQKRAEALQEELRDAERRLQGAEASLPLQLNHQASGTASSAPVDSLTVDPHLTNEERLALKLATLQQFHEEMVAVATESQAEHEKMLRKVEQRKVQAAIKQAVEPDFMPGVRGDWGGYDGHRGIRFTVLRWLFDLLAGLYGFLTAFDGITEEEAARRVEQMARLNIREWQFYDAVEGYSRPPAKGQAQWTNGAFYGRVSRKVLEAYIAAIRAAGGRSWLYVQAMATDPGDAELQSGHQMIGRHIVDGRPLLDVVAPTKTWAQRFAEQWGHFAAELNFTGIHWDSLGDWDGGKATAAGADFPGFLQETQKLLQALGLQQTANFVDGFGWSLEAKAVVEFPYWETWTIPAVSARFFAEAAQGGGAVWACYPGKDAAHDGEAQNRHFQGVEPAQLMSERWQAAQCTGNAYLLIGDGERRIQTEYFPDTVALTGEEILQLQNPKEDCNYSAYQSASQSVNAAKRARPSVMLLVLAADGFTYERQAIEKWLSMHNTSPMTGAVLAHRYLTENFALRHLIEAYESQLSDPRTGQAEDAATTAPGRGRIKDLPRPEPGESGATSVTCQMRRAKLGEV
ncbi:unnamed protein product [Effrenium voratum]|uniref:U-box domain-containing protein n=1 Tax=Effrenium voratum TaxID=2562239 RepID=A0AA36NDW8_9DINO|nr:unnamed protein product [Effrenium voratum]